MGAFLAGLAGAILGCFLGEAATRRNMRRIARDEIIRARVLFTGFEREEDARRYEVAVREFLNRG